MSIFTLLLTIVAALVVLRSVLLLFYAEAGRKQDLIKHIYRGGTDFHIALIVPYLDARKMGAFQELLTALANQDYPANRIGIHVVATEESAYALPQAEELSANVKTWTYPAKSTTRGTATSWLVERLLAAGGPSRLFVFLDADDIVRPDFLKNVTTRAYDCFAMQGYSALKRPPRGLLAQVTALSTRLINRIENAGRFHMGLSCRLMTSGWVVRQELLEMLPFRQGHDLDNLEYSTLLNLQGYRINWAPNVVVYKEEKVAALDLLKDVAHSLINRVRLTLRYTVPLLVQGITHFEPALYETLFGLVKPPNFILGLLFVQAVMVATTQPTSSVEFFVWGTLAAVYWSSQLISLAVARCSFRDVLTFAIVTPVVYAIGLVVFPIALVIGLFESTFHLFTKPKAVRVGRRFDETQAAQVPAASEVAKSRQLKRFSEMDDMENFRVDIDAESLEDLVASRKRFGLSARHEAADVATAIYETHSMDDLHVFGEGGRGVTDTLPEEVSLPITNGRESVQCTLRTMTTRDSQGETVYGLAFTYKSLTFQTQKYRILDQAYYELETKLQARGFSIVSCGSCAYFYRPTAGNAHGLAKNIGFCLFRKEGREVNAANDGVTVLSESCGGYTDMALRPATVKRWQDSMLSPSQS